MSRCIQMDQFLSAVVSQDASQLELMEQAPKKKGMNKIFLGWKIINNRINNQQMATSEIRNMKGDKDMFSTGNPGKNDLLSSTVNHASACERYL